MPISVLQYRKDEHNSKNIYISITLPANNGFHIYFHPLSSTPVCTDTDMFSFHSQNNIYWELLLTHTEYIFIKQEIVVL